MAITLELMQAQQQSTANPQVLITTLQADLADSERRNAALADALARAERAAAVAAVEAATTHTIVAEELGRFETDAQVQQQRADAEQREAAARHVAVALEVEHAERQAERSMQEAAEATVRGSLMSNELGATERSLSIASAASASAASAARSAPSATTSTTTSASVTMPFDGRRDPTTGPSGDLPDDGPSGSLLPDDT